MWMPTAFLFTPYMTTDSASAAKAAKRPALVYLLSERDAHLLEQHGIAPLTRNLRHLRQDKASKLVRTTGYRWVRSLGETTKAHPKFLVEVRSKGWVTRLGFGGFMTQQMVPGGVRL